ncbi:MAG TPA: FmdB family zinc ribbon protein [Comamonas sp.]|uniref:FmdB family zinc ribbon protein n=1 Tax=Comamonas halotolerans TaxID=3041496 RepID=UPI0024E08208|nr:FmdB family zinc ribbon protein [Comamonas sp. NoAH]
MPIYAYKCGACGHAKDVLQKMSDAPLSECPACGAAAFSKQLTAPGFQLKGTGWYATDFKGGSSSTAASAAPAAACDSGGSACAAAGCPAATEA